eukprot:357715-Chlamydomonas_euryale.AAC.12
MPRAAFDPWEHVAGDLLTATRGADADLPRGGGGPDEISVERDSFGPACLTQHTPPHNRVWTHNYAAHLDLCAMKIMWMNEIYFSVKQTACARLELHSTAA